MAFTIINNQKIELVNIDGVDIPFDSTWKNIAISVSGGADSALLAYLLCSLVTNHKTTFHILSHIRCWKTKPWQRYDNIRVFKWLTQRFNHINFIRHENFIAPELEWADKGPTIIDEYGKLVSGDSLEIRAFAEYIGHSNNVDAYYNAVNRNPRSIMFDNRMLTRDIERTNDQKHKELMIHMGKVASHPFRFVEKDWIIKQYYRLGILDLLDNTRSCEGDNTTHPEIFKGLDYKTYIPDQKVPVCGTCFWCKEKEWALQCQD